MRRRMLTPLLAALVLVALLVPATADALAERDAPAPDPRPVARAAPTIRLGCALIGGRPATSTDGLAALPVLAPAVVCRWSAVEVDAVRAYRLWRVMDAPGGARMLVATIPAGERLRFVDRRVRPGHAYTYAVVALAKDGSRIAVSRRVVVRIPVPAETLRLACAPGTDGDQRGVACRWSEARHPAAAGYVLWRSVDGGPREAIYKARLDGRRGFFDTRIEPGQVIRYAVIVVDRTGAPVGRGGPVVVRIPVPAEAIGPGSRP